MKNVDQTRDILISYSFIVIIFLIGWVINLFQLLCGFELTTYTSFKLIGVIIVPFGSIMGFIGMFV